MRPRGFVSLAGCLSHVSAALFFRDPEICGESLAELVVGRGSRKASRGSLSRVAHGERVGERAARARGRVEEESSEDDGRVGAGIVEQLEPMTPTDKEGEKEKAHQQKGPKEGEDAVVRGEIHCR